MGAESLSRYFAIPLLLALVVVGAWWEPARWTLYVSGPLLALTLWDFFQRRHCLRRNYPLVARFRWLMLDLRPFLRSYIIESDLEGTPFSHDARALVYARAKGTLDAHPFGTEFDVYASEYEWLGHSIAPETHGSTEWRVPVGGSQCSKPYDAALLNISAMSFGSLSAHAILALNKGAKLGGFYHDTGEGGLSLYHRAHGGDLVWEIGSGYFGCRDDEGKFDPARFADTAQLDQVRMVEIKLSQGAKPGHGGVLPGVKVTEEIAAARGVPAGEACISPAAHSSFSTPIELLEWAASLREMAGGKPVGIKLCVGQPHELFAIVKAMLETGIRLDFITVDGGEGGTGAAPQEFSDHIGMPLREGLIFVRNALVGCSLKPEIKIAAAGKIHSGAGMAFNIALGADWCNAARAFMFSVGCVQSMKCHTDKCPTGVATQDPGRQRGLVVDEKAKRAARFQRQTLASFRQIVAAMGLEDPWQMRPHDIRERLNPARSHAMDRIYSFLEEGALLADPDATAYARHWRSAQPESFRAAE